MLTVDAAQSSSESAPAHALVDRGPLPWVGRRLCAAPGHPWPLDHAHQYDRARASQPATAAHEVKLPLFADERINSVSIRPNNGRQNLIALIQRVTEASVAIQGDIVGEISRGLLAFIAVQPEDKPQRVARMAERILTYRVFPDAEDRMNQSLQDQGLELLVVPQFTLAADTRKGTRPSFTRAAPAETGRKFFDLFVQECGKQLPAVACGRFGANMQVSLINDGPVTFWLET